MNWNRCINLAYLSVFLKYLSFSLFRHCQKKNLLHSFNSERNKRWWLIWNEWSTVYNKKIWFNETIPTSICLYVYYDVNRPAHIHTHSVLSCIFIAMYCASCRSFYHETNLANLFCVFFIYLHSKLDPHDLDWQVRIWKAIFLLCVLPLLFVCVSVFIHIRLCVCLIW